MSEHKSIYEALVAAKAEFPPIHRNAVNPFHKNKYADLSTILKAVEPVLAKHGLVVMQRAYSEQKDDGRCVVGVTTWLAHSSGEVIGDDFKSLGQWVENNTQKIGAVVTYLRRYSLAAFLSIAADDDDDGNTASSVGVEPARRENATSHAGQAPSPSRTATKKQVERLYELWEACGTPLDAQNKFLDMCKVTDAYQLSHGQVGAAIAKLKMRLEILERERQSLQGEPESAQ